MWLAVMILLMCIPGCRCPLYECAAAGSTARFRAMLVTSRSFAEYAAMFDLQDGDLSGRVIDCCAGASSFVAEAWAAGHDVIAIDPSYAMPRSELLRSVADSVAGAVALIDDHADRFVWDWYDGSRERRAAIRADAAQAFIAHITAHPQSYLAGALPQLPFPDGSVDLLLCSHLLFTWSSRQGGADLPARRTGDWRPGALSRSPAPRRTC